MHSSRMRTAHSLPYGGGLYGGLPGQTHPPRPDKHLWKWNENAIPSYDHLEVYACNFTISLLRRIKHLLYWLPHFISWCAVFFAVWVKVCTRAGTTCKDLINQLLLARTMNCMSNKDVSFYMVLPLVLSPNSCTWKPWSPAVRPATSPDTLTGESPPSWGVKTDLFNTM